VVGVGAGTGFGVVDNEGGLLKEKGGGCALNAPPVKGLKAGGSLRAKGDG